MKMLSFWLLHGVENILVFAGFLGYPVALDFDIAVSFEYHFSHISSLELTVGQSAFETSLEFMKNCCKFIRK